MQVFSSWSILLREYLKRDRRLIIVWVSFISLFSTLFVNVFQLITGGVGGNVFFDIMGNPIFTALLGPTPVTEISDYTIGAMYAHEMLLFCALMAMVIAALFMVNHSRKQEDIGLTEMLRSFKVGRHANSLAIFIESVLIHLLITLAITLLLVSFQIESVDWPGSLAYGASIGLGGLLGGQFALILAQIFPNAGSALGGSIFLLGGLYVARGLTDISQPHLSPWNPMAWTYLSFPFVDNNWLYLLILLLFSLALFGLAIFLEAQRDLGGSFLSSRLGPERAGASLLSLPGLVWRLHRGMIMAWLIGFLLLGIAYGSIYGDLDKFMTSNELISSIFAFSGISLEASYTGIIMLVLMGILAILPMTLVLQLYRIEQLGYLNQFTATPISRQRWYWTYIFLTIFATMISSLLVASSLWFTSQLVLVTAPMTYQEYLLIAINYWPSLFLFMGAMALAVGLYPSFAKYLYAYLTFSVMYTYLAPAFNLPDEILWFTVHDYLPRLPMESFQWTPWLSMMALALILLIIGQLTYQRRDLLAN